MLAYVRLATMYRSSNAVDTISIAIACGCLRPSKTMAIAIPAGGNRTVVSHPAISSGRELSGVGPV